MISSELPPWLRELKGAPVSILLALRWVHQPVEQIWLQDATGFKRDTVRDGMRLLKRLGFATFDGDGYCTNCQLTGAAQQLPLGYDLLDQPDQPDLVDPAPLQAEVPLDPAEQDSTAIKSQLALIVLRDESDSLSINNNKNAPSAKKSQLSRGQAAHVAEVVQALKLRHVRAAAGDNPLPLDLRVCAERLVALGVSAARADLAVALCTWPPAEILAQITAWAAYCQSPITGKNLDGRWPYLVATRIQTATVCPPPAAGSDQADSSRYDGYLHPDGPDTDTDDPPQEGAPA